MNLAEATAKVHTPLQRTRARMWVGYMNKSPTPGFRLSLLGRFELTGSDGPIDLTSKKLVGLVAFLACTTPEPQRREKLMALLWGSHFEAQARQNLRQALARLRRNLGPGAFVTNGETVSLHPDAMACDVVRFEALARRGGRGALAEAVELYKDRFLTDIAIAEEAWTEWLEVERNRLEGLALDAMIKLAECELQSGNAEGALRAAQRATSVNYLREDAHRLVIRGLVASGRRLEALQHYDRLVALLKRELNILPDSLTRKLVEEIRIERRSRQTGSALSIAVLPFDSASGDSSQQHLADGITEGIITDLSRFANICVATRHASFHLGRQAANATQTARELGVSYIVEGSVRKIGEHTRTTVQLIDATTGNHVWAGRYDRASGEILAVQDEVILAIVTTLEGRMVTYGAATARKKPTANWSVSDCLFQGREYCNLNREPEAVPFFRRAIAIDPDLTQAQAWLSMSLSEVFVVSAERQTLDEAAQAAQRALSLDGNQSISYWASALALLLLRRYEQARVHFERAIAFNPMDMQIRGDWANWLRYSGHPEEGLATINEALKHTPFPPHWFWAVQGKILFDLGKYKESISALNNIVAIDHLDYVYHAAANAYLGDMTSASHALAKAKELRPTLSRPELTTVLPYAASKALDHLFDGCEKAGLAE